MIQKKMRILHLYFLADDAHADIVNPIHTHGERTAYRSNACTSACRSGPACLRPTDNRKRKLAHIVHIPPAAPFAGSAASPGRWHRWPPKMWPTAPAKQQSPSPCPTRAVESSHDGVLEFVTSVFGHHSLDTYHVCAESKMQ